MDKKVKIPDMFSGFEEAVFSKNEEEFAEIRKEVEKESIGSSENLLEEILEHEAKNTITALKSVGLICEMARIGLIAIKKKNHGINEDNCRLVNDIGKMILSAVKIQSTIDPNSREGVLRDMIDTAKNVANIDEENPIEDSEIDGDPCL